MKEFIIDYTDFVDRQFKEDFKGTNLSKYDKADFLSKLRDVSEKLHLTLKKVEGASKLMYTDESGMVKIVEGYAPFCKLLFVPNFTDVKTGTVPITMSNERFLQSDYVKRRTDEKAVLTRFLNIPYSLKHEIPVAEYLMVILYSKKQIDSENLETWRDNGSVGDKPEPFYGDYGIVSINAQMVDFEEPMSPMTMMRNALGKSEGGSDTSIDTEAYEKSVEFWKHNAIVS